MSRVYAEFVKGLILCILHHHGCRQQLLVLGDKQIDDLTGLSLGWQWWEWRPMQTWQSFGQAPCIQESVVSKSLKTMSGLQGLTEVSRVTWPG